MTKKLQKTVAFMLAVIMAMTLNLSSGTLGIFDFVKTVNAATITATQPTSGSGSSSSPYQIGTAGELYWFANYVNSGNTSACAVLTANITVNTGVLSSSGSLNSGSFTAWTPIGSGSNIYRGTFDGKGFTISGLYLSDSSTKYIGLFGYARGNISNVGVVDSYFNGCYYIGGLCGYSPSSTITNCYNAGSVTTNKNNDNNTNFNTKYAGGLCGYSNGTITGCYNTGYIKNTSRNSGSSNGVGNGIGGLVGINYNSGKIINCYNAGDISSTITRNSRYIGGVCGSNYGTVTNCYNTGSISSSASDSANYLGGVCGYIFSGTVTNCYSTGNASYGTSTDGTSYAGGVCGYLYNVTIINNCYYNSSTFSGSAIGYIRESTLRGTVGEDLLGKTTNQFKSGEVCYLLNGSTSEGDLAWYQSIGSDAYPVFSGGTVIYVYNLTTEKYEYKNACSSHQYTNGFCTKCFFCEEPEVDNSIYQIANIGNLLWFAAYVNRGNTTANAVLTADIDLSSISRWPSIGNSGNGYAGTFDGNNYTIKNMSITKQGTYSGLFGYTSGATIKNIKITGNITLTTTSYTEAYGSIVGGASDTDITNCHSSVNITISKDSTIDSSRSSCIGHIGGIVGQVLNPVGTVSNCSYSGTIELNDRPVNVAAGIAAYSSYNASPTITNCSFTGAINSTNADAIILGGIFGYVNTGNDVNLANCLSAGTITKSGSTSTNGMIIGQINNGYGNNCVKNNYYLSSSVSGVGSISGTPTTTPATACTQAELKSGKICYLLNGSTSEGDLAWGQQIGRDTYPVLGGKTVYYMYNNITGKYVYTNGCITHNYSNGICSVCDDYEEPTQDANSVYQIANAGNLCWFAYYVNRGNTTVNAVLIADIDFSSYTFTSIGTADNPFSGIFDGCGYTITVNQSGSSDVAIFGRIGNCTIKNLVVDGTINTGEKFAAGIAMQNVEGYTANIENCISDVTIASSINGDGTHGGIIGVVDGGVNINNCAFTGAMTGSNTDSCGGIIGWTDETSTISNSYVAADFSISSTNCNTFSRYWKANSVIVSNCYYLNKINAVPSGATQMSEDQFASGEVCYKLNGGVTDGTQAWYQTLAEDTLPKFEGKTVFYNESVESKYFDAVFGDVSNNDIIDKADAALVLKYISDIGTLNAEQLAVADVNGDGEVDMLDVIKILELAG